MGASLLKKNIKHPVIADFSPLTVSLERPRGPTRVRIYDIKRTGCILKSSLSFYTVLLLREFMPYGWVTVVASRLTAVCANSLPLIEERFPNVIDV
jgi:hypothetical protein